MATKQLTPRQQEVKDLLDAGKTPTEVAKALKMSENNVYQHIRRMGASKGKSSTRKSTARKTTARRTTKATANRSTARRSSGRKTAPRPRPAPAPAPTEVQVREMTPLQAIRHRMKEIEGQLSESAKRVADAERVLKGEQESHARLEANRDTELKQLKAAEAALSGAKPAARKPAPRNNGTGSKAAAGKAAAQTPPAAPAEAPAEPPAAPEPEPVAAGEGESRVTETVGEERPGVDTLPEFSQEGEDAFGSSGEEDQTLVGGES